MSLPLQLALEALYGLERRRDKHDLEGTIALRPRIFLGWEEKAAGLLADGQIAVQSTGLGARMPMRNKEWGVDRMQEVVKRLRHDRPVVQLGAPGDPPLDGVIDARGASFRRSAAILSRSSCFVGLVGFLMHLARAVDCRSVIVFGGREAPWQTRLSREREPLHGSCLRPMLALEPLRLRTQVPQRDRAGAGPLPDAATRDPEAPRTGRPRCRRLARREARRREEGRKRRSR